MVDTVHILGAGLAGMAAAANLKSKGFDGKINLYEASNHIGGRCYSFISPYLNVKIDNGTHMMLKANYNLLAFLKIINSTKELYPFFPKIKNSSYNLKKLWNLGVVSALNTKYVNADKLLFLKTILKALQNPHPLFVKNTLEDLLVIPFNNFAKTHNIQIKYGKKCLGYEPKKLIFSDTMLELTTKDVVIFALPQRSFARIFNLPILPHNPITNVHFLLKTKNNSFNFVGQTNGLTEWFKVKENILSATISATNTKDINTVKNEAKKIFNLNDSDFIAHTIICEKMATISQDKETILKRNKILELLPHDIIIAGDWTQQDLPCTMEAAVTSGFNAVKRI